MCTCLVVAVVLLHAIEDSTTWLLHTMKPCATLCDPGGSRPTAHAARKTPDTLRMLLSI